MLYVLLEGALRISELMNGLKVHLGQDGILLVFGKGATEREVALSARTVLAIQDYLATRANSSPFLFASGEGKQLTYEGVKSLFHRWKKTAPTAFEEVWPSAHTLRHTSAYHPRISAGISISFSRFATPYRVRSSTQSQLNIWTTAQAPLPQAGWSFNPSLSISHHAFLMRSPPSWVISASRR